MNETNREAVITVKDVSFTYEELPEGTSEASARASGVNMAVDKMDLQIYDGECVAVLGHNGSGKSTLAKLCNGILIPDYGDILVYGINTRDEDRLLELRQKVGMVFQNPDNQIVATVVEEDVAFGPENLGFPPEEIRARVESALKAVGMYKHRGKEPHKLSGGQKQRVAIAGILAMKPECILFDESTAMLDPKGRRSIMRIIRKMHDEMGKTVVYITHYMEEAAVADRVIVMEDGKVIDDGTPSAVFSNIEIEPGELVAVIGHTGSGKSTLIQHFNGLLKPQSGKVYVDGQDIWESKKTLRASRFAVGLCFQYPEYQLFEETVYKDIAFGPKNMKLSEEEIDRRVRDAARYIGVTDDMLETAGLDPRGRDTILGLIRNYREETGRTVMIVSHSMDDVAEIASKVLVINNARVAMYGTVPEIYARSEELVSMGLDIPQVTKVFLGLKENGIPVRTDVYTVEQARAQLRELREKGVLAW